MRPQLGSAPWTAVLTSEDAATVRATARASASSAAPFTVTSMRCSAPSPSAAIAIARDRQTASRASANAPTSSAAIEAAAGRTVGEHEDRVVGRGVAVDRHLVEAAIDGRPQQRPERRGVDGRIGGEEGEHRRHLRMDHAGALGHAADADHAAIGQAGRDRVLLRARVGGHDRPCRLPRRGPRATWLQGGDDGLHGGYRKPRADEASRGREDLVRLAAEMSGSRSHDGARVVQSAGTGPGVRAAGVHDDPTHGRGAGGERLLGQQHRRRPHQVGGEGRRRACRPVGRQQHQVGAARLADAGHADGHREALRGRDPSGDDGCAHG